LTREQRKLAAIVAADVVGYSRLMGRDESGTVARLRKVREQQLAPILARRGGRIVKLTGDGAIIEFASAVEALSAAIEFQQTRAQEARGEPADNALLFRIGLHLGDLIVDGDDLYGDGLNVAARLEAEAPAGGVVVSATAREFVGERTKARFVDLGELALKNIERPVRAYRVEWNAADWPAVPETGPKAMSDGAPQAAALALPDKPSIAVLPFQNMSGDPEQEYFVDGLVEDLTTALSRFRSLFVIARNSSFTYKGRAADVRQVGRELGVRYVLEGSVRKAGDRVRITGQLIDTASGSHLWADRFDGALQDVFDLQDRITEAVAGTIAPTIEQAEVSRVRHTPPRTLDAYDLYLRSLAEYYEMTRESFGRSAKLIEQALKLDPDYVPALLAGLRTVSMHLVQGWGSRDEITRVSLEYTERALRLDKDNADVLAFVARSRAFFHGIDEETLELAKRATVINSNSSYTWMHCGWVHAWAARGHEAVGYLERAIRISPRDPNNFETWTGLTLALIQAGREEEAVTAGRLAVQQGPYFRVAWRFLVAALALAGRRDEASTALNRLLVIEPDSRVSTALASKNFTAQRQVLEGLRLAGLPE
jgi:adenylate cyclase